MRESIVVGDRVKLLLTGAEGTVTDIDYYVRFDGDSDADFFPASAIARLIPLEEVTAEAQEQSKLAGAAIERAKLIIAKRSSGDTLVLQDLVGLAIDVTTLLGVVPSGVARPLAEIASRLAALIEREMSRCRCAD